MFFKVKLSIAILVFSLIHFRFTKYKNVILSLGWFIVTFDLTVRIVSEVKI